MAVSHNTIERWLPVVGYEGLYEVSDHGRVRTVGRVEVTKAGYTRRRRSIILRMQQDRGGYMETILSREGKRHNVRVHRLVLEAFVGACPADMVACHNNGDPADNRLDNLRWDSQSSNVRDTIKHGRHSEASKTHCPQGHLLQAPNLVNSELKRGYRKCMACSRAHSRVDYHPELRPDFQQIADSYHQAIISPGG